jgi:tyrosyl-tRNA synthetase
MLSQSAVKVDGKKVIKEDFLVKINKKTLIQVGKRRHLKITLKSSN